MIVDASLLRKALRGPQGRDGLVRLARFLGVHVSPNDVTLAKTLHQRIHALWTRDELDRLAEKDGAA